ncbi:hypothetical protein JOM56_013768 [Amanita muscaria]
MSSSTAGLWGGSLPQEFRFPSDYSFPASQMPASSRYSGDSAHTAQIPSSINLDIIAAATHEILIRSGNPAYTNLHANFTRLSAEAQSSRDETLVKSYEDFIQHLKSTVLQQEARIEHLEKSEPQVSTSDFRGAYSSTTTHQISAPPNGPAFKIPPAPPMYDKDNYPGVRFWSRESWREYANRQEERGTSVPKLDFLTDKDGAVVSSDRLKEMTRHAKMAWSELYYYRLAPEQWGKRSAQATDYFSNTMMDKFEEFRLCDDRWKAEVFGTVKFPDWASKVRDSSHSSLPRAIPSFRTSEDGQTKKPLKQAVKKRKIKNSPPSNVQVIEIDDKEPETAEVEHGPQASSHGATSLRKRKRPDDMDSDHSGSSSGDDSKTMDTTPQSGPAPVTTSDTTGKPEDASEHSRSSTQGPFPGLQGMDSNTPATHHNQTSEVQTTLQASITPSSPKASTAVSSAAPNAITLQQATSPNNDVTLGSVSANGHDNAVHTSVTSLPGNSDAPGTSAMQTGPSPETLENTPSENAPGTTPMPSTDQFEPDQSGGNLRRPRPRRIRPNPLANHNVPPTAPSIPVHDPPAATTAKKSNPRLAKPKENCFTDRNLYMIDYLETQPPNSVTNEQFTKVWTNLDANVKAQYKARAVREKKNAKTKPTPAAAAGTAAQIE